MKPSDQRRRAYRRGHWAERLAALALILKGYRIVERRYRTRVGEIDIIARRRDLVIFVEVKARASRRTALDSINATTRKRIEKASLWWLARQPDGATLARRYDIIAVQPRRWPVHFENAWQGRS